MICFHDWYMWSELVKGCDGDRYQFRDCVKCGKTQARSLGNCGGSDVSQANSAIREIHQRGNSKP